MSSESSSWEGRTDEDQQDSGFTLNQLLYAVPVTGTDHIVCSVRDHVLHAFHFLLLFPLAPLSHSPSLSSIFLFELLC